MLQTQFSCLVSGTGVRVLAFVFLDDLSECTDRKDQWFHECIDHVLDIQQQFLELEKLKFELMKQQYDQKHMEVCKTMANY